MSKQTNDNNRYTVYYGAERNAALQPEYVPEKKTKKKKSAEEKEAETLLCAERGRERTIVCFLVLLAIAIAFAGGFTLMRNAQVYKNTQTIRALAKQKQTAITKINDIELALSENCEINSYCVIAEDELNLIIADDSNTVTVVCPVSEETVVSEETEQIDVFDTAVDWLSSIERMIKDWL